MLKKNYNVPANKIIMMYNSIEPLNITYKENKDNLRNKFGIPADAKIILFLGRISVDKGVDLLIEAFNKIQIQLPQYFSFNCWSNL